MTNYYQPKAHPSPNKNAFQRMGIKKAAYLKYGDVQSELKQLNNEGSIDGDIGYFSRFYELAKNTSLLLISFNRYSIKVKNHGSPIYVFDSKNLSGPFGKIINNLFKIIIPLQLLIKNKPDFILCGTTDFSFLGAFFASKLICRPILVSLHHALPLGDDLLDRLRKTLYKTMLRNCDGVMCNGPYLKDEMIFAGVSRDKIIEYLPTFGELKTNSNNIFPNELKDYILFAGRLEEKKGVYDLLSAYRENLAAHKNLKLVYAGEGPSFEGLKAKAKDWNLDGKVIFLGQVSYSNVGALIRKSRFVVVPSRSTMCEGICKVAVESQLLGKPVIVPKYGVFPYIVKHRWNGLLFATDSVADLAEKIKILLCDQRLYTSLKAGAITAGKKFELPETTFSDAIITSLEKIDFPEMKHYK